MTSAGASKMRSETLARRFTTHHSYRISIAPSTPATMSKQQATLSKQHSTLLPKRQQCRTSLS